MSGTTIDSLPAELLRDVLSHVDDKTIPQARLVSRRFRDAATPYLLTYVPVHATSESLSKLEEVSSHDTFRTSITRVDVFLCTFNVNLVDRNSFIRDLATRTLRHLEMTERSGRWRYRTRPGDPDGDDVNCEAVQKPVEDRLGQLTWGRELERPLDEGFDEAKATDMQQVSFRLHEAYRRRCEDQEDIRRGNRHVDRIAAALARFPGLRDLRFLDVPRATKVVLREADFADLGVKRAMLKHFDAILQPSTWTGSFQTAYTIRPAVEMLGELGARLGRDGARPRSVTVMMTAPADLRVMTLSDEQQDGIRQLVSRAASVDLRVDGWQRRNSLAENNDRSRAEMQHLCSLTRPLFSSPHLEWLRIYFAEFPPFHQTPTVSISDVLPLNEPWPKLRTAKLMYQAFTLEDLRALVKLQGGVVRDLDIECAWLLDGQWREAVEVLRGFEALESVSMRFCRGGEVDRNSVLGGYKDQPEICDYILGRTDVNPLAVEMV